MLVINKGISLAVSTDDLDYRSPPFVEIDTTQHYFVHRHHLQTHQTNGNYTTSEKQLTMDNDNNGPEAEQQQHSGTAGRFGAFANAIRMLRRASFGDEHSTEQRVGEGEEEEEQEEQRDFSPPPLQPVELVGHTAQLKRRVLSPSLCEEIRGLLPARLQLADKWHLAYSLEQNGASLHTLYEKCVPDRGKRPGFVMAIKDENGFVFGAYVNEYFHPMEGRRFYGNGESFLWKTLRLEDGETRFQAFPYAGLNDYVIYCTSDFLSMGGGDGHYGLWIDDDLYKGVSSRSLTFGNEPLSESGTKFRIVALEVWRVS